MAKIIGIVVLILIFAGIGFIIYNDMQNEVLDDVGEKTGVDVSQLKDIVKSIKCNTDEKSFDCGKVHFQTNNNAVQSQTETVQVTEQQQVQLSNGTVVTQNVTTTKQVPKVSDANITFLDKQTGDFMVCFQGHQCIIEAEIQLYNMAEEYVEPPYTYQLTITCDFREWCDTKRTNSTNAGTTTDSVGNVSYSWTTNYQDSLGDYEIILSIRSAVPDLDGNPINLIEKIPLVLID